MLPVTLTYMHHALLARHHHCRKNGSEMGNIWCLPFSIRKTYGFIGLVKPVCIYIAFVYSISKSHFWKKMMHLFKTKSTYFVVHPSSCLLNTLPLMTGGVRGQATAQQDTISPSAERLKLEP